MLQKELVGKSDRLIRFVPCYDCLSYSAFSGLTSSSLLLEIIHVGGGNGLSKEFQSTQGRNLASVVVFDKEGNSLDALVVYVFEQYIVGIFFQVLASQFNSGGRIHVLNVFEPEIVAIDKKQDACLGRKKQL